MPAHQPSPSQRHALNQLPAHRALLLQAHWIWREEVSHSSELTACLARLQSLGGRSLTWTRCDTQVIGARTPAWQSACVWALPSRDALLNLVESREWTALTHQANDLMALVALQPARSVLRVLRWTQTLMRLLPAPAASLPIPAESISGGVNPSPIQFEAFKTSPQHTTIHMFNWLKFERQVKFHAGDSPRSGKRLYNERYAPVACQCIFRLGGRIVAMGRYAFTLVGQQGDPMPDAWDELVVAQYPGRSAFLRMLSNPAYQRAVEHRERALARTLLWSTSPE